MGSIKVFAVLPPCKAVHISQYADSHLDAFCRHSRFKSSSIVISDLRLRQPLVDSFACMQPAMAHRCTQQLLAIKFRWYSPCIDPAGKQGGARAASLLKALALSRRPHLGTLRVLRDMHAILTLYRTVCAAGKETDSNAQERQRYLQARSCLRPF